QREDAEQAARSPAPPAKVNRFDGGRALRLVKLQVGVGQRPAGSPQLRRLAVRLRALLPEGRFEDLPGHPGLRNVVGSLPGRAPAIVLGAHYDTEVSPKGFVGANDSAAGTAVLLEVARALQRLPRSERAREIRFVLFDGEEEPRPTEDFYRDALRGSKAYVQAHAEEVGEMVLLDYVGNKGLRLPREATSDEGLWRRVRAAARRAGVAPVFPAATGAGVLDDHTPFLRAGIPAVDLIDFDYRYRDTTRDTVDKLSVASLDAVGETIVELLRR
ncbi:MAG: Zn-dependent exopeptidase M28, partial [Solirubrobacterales bacterium]|nr:Zn-dependent exopeptidase M28 [Solirubrobacterales bacterium]